MMKKGLYNNAIQLLMVKEVNCWKIGNSIFLSIFYKVILIKRKLMTR